MENLFSPERLASVLELVQTWISERLFTTATLIELCVIAFAALLAWLLAPRLRAITDQSTFTTPREY